jgi:hypothetical protein
MSALCQKRTFQVVDYYSETGWAVREFPRGRPLRETMKMDGLTLFGLFAVTAMMLCYAFEGRSPWFVLAFAGTCVLASIYGFLQGAWPFGIVEGIWALVALRRWQKQAALV